MHVKTPVVIQLAIIIFNDYIAFALFWEAFLSVTKHKVRVLLLISIKKLA